MAHAIALFSGGLDSSLAILCLLRMGVKVTAVHFKNYFGCVSSEGIQGFRQTADRYGFELLIVDIQQDFLEIVKRPLFGYGKNMNPCIDCKTMMLKKAGEIMGQRASDCIVTGEVIGQRPMSQQRHIFNLMEKRTGLKGYILRPLSALLLSPTIAEERGDIDRQRLFGFSGRSRKPQMALAAELGLKGYPAPAGGCLLTEPNFAARLKELLRHNPNPETTEIELLKVGRHFRLPEGRKVIVGRSEGDNARLRALINIDTLSLEVEGIKGPLVIVADRDITEEGLRLAAALCARYSDAKGSENVKVNIYQGGYPRGAIMVNPHDGKGLEDLMIRLQNKWTNQYSISSI